ncbi:ABC transporter ATP-binding protein [Phenylobacterium montanum]|uniref:ATP-binding cassette domain-containing protein n=1 Tax=Phenylobacterium montanum TaxID=2823693 RepID=A0A975FXX4_9CAUL|nr:ATP-binding cassette domain-containing protein [Caulobacter sp. S6]QUD86873.1 ATP-binding cassette domain-containing protein [Caulobacter sp. S6]
MAGALRTEDLSSRLAGPFDVVVEPGEALAVTGASGAGKSLFLRMIADLDPNRGEVFLGDVARSGLPAHDWRRRVVYVGAETGWWSDEVAAHIAPEHAASAADLAARLGLATELLSAKVARLSTGERQRLALIRALVRAPPALLLDEPTAALDRDSVGKVEDLLAERLAAGTVLVLVTHDPGQAQRLARRHLVMKAGKLVQPS